MTNDKPSKDVHIRCKGVQIGFLIEGEKINWSNSRGNHRMHISMITPKHIYIHSHRFKCKLTKFDEDYVYTEEDRRRRLVSIYRIPLSEYERLKWKYDERNE